eukprot:1138554-Rhodomonas_salina.2
MALASSYDKGTSLLAEYQTTTPTKSVSSRTHFSRAYAKLRALARICALYCWHHSICTLLVGQRVHCER